MYNNKMDAYQKASRAVIAEYISKFIFPYEIIAITFFVISFLLTSYLIIQISQWWWLLMILILGYGIIGSIVWLIVHTAIDKLKPHQNLEQKRAVKDFIEQIGIVSDIVHISKFTLLIKIIVEVVRKKQIDLIQDLTKNSVDLHKKFILLVKLFK